MNEYQELVRTNFGDYDPHLYRCIIKALDGRTNHHEALRALFGIMNQIERLTDVLSERVSVTQAEPTQASSHPSH